MHTQTYVFSAVDEQEFETVDTHEEERDVGHHVKGVWDAAAAEHRTLIRKIVICMRDMFTYTVAFAIGAKQLKSYALELQA